VQRWFKKLKQQLNGLIPRRKKMEITFFLIGLLLLGIGIFVKIFNIKFLGIELHKVEPNKVTIVEKSFSFSGKIEKKKLTPGLYPTLWIEPFYIPKRKNLPLFQFSIEPLAGMEEDWNDWEIKSKHPVNEIDWDAVPGVELQGGSTALIEFLLIFKIVKPKKFLYKNENSVETMISISKSVIRKSFSDLSFSGAMEISEEKQKELFTTVKSSLDNLSIGIKLISPDDGSFIKNIYPCPATKEGRALRFDAKQKGKAEVEIATGQALADAKLGKGWGEKIKQKAIVSGVGIDNAFAHENLETAGNVLGDKTVILGGGGKGINEMVAGLVATGTAVVNNSKTNTTNTKGDTE
jgi:hypothetical protein